MHTIDIYQERDTLQLRLLLVSRNPDAIRRLIDGVSCKVVASVVSSLLVKALRVAAGLPPRVKASTSEWVANWRRGAGEEGVEDGVPVGIPKHLANYDPMKEAVNVALLAARVAGMATVSVYHYAYGRLLNPVQRELLTRAAGMVGERDASLLQHRLVLRQHIPPPPSLQPESPTPKLQNLVDAATQARRKQEAEAQQQLELLAQHLPPPPPSEACMEAITQRITEGDAPLGAVVDVVQYKVQAEGLASTRPLLQHLAAMGAEGSKGEANSVEEHDMLAVHILPVARHLLLMAGLIPGKEEDAAPYLRPLAHSNPVEGLLTDTLNPPSGSSHALRSITRSMLIAKRGSEGGDTALKAAWVVERCMQALREDIAWCEDDEGYLRAELLDTVPWKDDTDLHRVVSEHASLMAQQQAGDDRRRLAFIADTFTATSSPPRKRPKVDGDGVLLECLRKRLETRTIDNEFLDALSAWLRSQSLRRPLPAEYAPALLAAALRLLNMHFGLNIPRPSKSSLFCAVSAWNVEPVSSRFYTISFREALVEMFEELALQLCGVVTEGSLSIPGRFLVEAATAALALHSYTSAVKLAGLAIIGADDLSKDAVMVLSTALEHLDCPVVAHILHFLLGTPYELVAFTERDFELLPLLIPTCSNRAVLESLDGHLAACGSDVHRLRALLQAVMERLYHERRSATTPDAIRSVVSLILRRL